MHSLADTHRLAFTLGLVAFLIICRIEAVNCFKIRSKPEQQSSSNRFQGAKPGESSERQQCKKLAGKMLGMSQAVGKKRAKNLLGFYRITTRKASDFVALFTSKLSLEAGKS